MNSALRNIAVLLATTLLLGVGALTSEAATTVKVSLWDKGANVPMPKGLVYNAPGLDLSKATMGIKASPDAVRPGKSHSR